MANSCHAEEGELNSGLLALRAAKASLKRSPVLEGVTLEAQRGLLGQDRLEGDRAMGARGGVKGPHNHWAVLIDEIAQATSSSI